MKNVIRFLIFLLTICVLLTACACDKGTSGDESGKGLKPAKLSFKSAMGYDTLKALEGKTVTINGYMATSSPADGSFLFLMNLPYQSCPFCKPNTSQLSNTMEVYPKDGKSFDYTTQAIKVTGKLVVAPYDQPFTDLYGYEFNFKVVDADYVILKSEDLGADMALWQKIAESDIVSELYRMYDYVNFVCCWNTYAVDSFTDADGNLVTGYYLYAADALNYLQKEGAQFNYGYQPGYFEGLISRIEKIDPTAFTVLVKNIRDAEDLAKRALTALENGEYTYELQYVERFGIEDYIYTINEGETFKTEMDHVYLAFTDWLAGWEL